MTSSCIPILVPSLVLITILFDAKLGASNEAVDNSLPARVEGMVLVPGGTFQMGGDAGLMDGESQSHGTSYPIHTVSIDPFYMDIRRLLTHSSLHLLKLLIT